MKKLAVLVLLALMAGCGKDPMAERDKYFASAQKYMETKKYEEASIEFQNAIRADAGHIPSYLGIAQAFQQLGNHRDAIATYQQVVKLDGKNVAARLKLGEYQLLAATQNPIIFKQVQENAEAVLKLEPSNVDAMVLLGNAFAGQKDFEKALSYYEKALSLDRKNLKATMNLAAVQLNMKKPALAETTFKKAMEDHPDEIQPYLAIASFYASTGRLQETENQLKKAFDMAPADPRSVNALSSFYMAAGKPAGAENVFRRAIERNPKDREPRWGLANFYLRTGNTDKGVDALTELLTIHKGDREALLRLAEIDISRKNDTKAEERIKEILAVNKNDAQAHLLQGTIYRRRQEYNKAMTEFESAIKLDGSLSRTYLEKANLLLMRGDLDASEAALKEAMRRNSGYVPARGAYAKLLAMRNRPQEALKMADEVLTVMPNNEDAIGARAEALRASGKWAESKEEWLRLCQMQPQNAQYWHRLGTVETMQAEYASAMNRFRKAVEIDPRFVMAINDILYLHLRDRKFDAALAELDSLEQKSTPKDEIHRLRGQVLAAKGDVAAAEAEFRKAIEVNPRNSQSYMLLGSIHADRNNLPQAIKEVDRLIARNDRLPSAFLLKAHYLQLSKDTAGAIENYRKALKLDPDNTTANNNLAWLLSEAGTGLEEALNLARAARRKDPDNPEIADTLGWIYYKMKNYTLAVDQLLFSVNNRRQPRAQHYYRLGMAYHAKGDRTLAKQTLRKALDLDSRFAGADEARQILKRI